MENFSFVWTCLTLSTISCMNNNPPEIAKRLHMQSHMTAGWNTYEKSRNTLKKSTCCRWKYARIIFSSILRHFCQLNCFKVPTTSMYSENIFFHSFVRSSFAWALSLIECNVRWISSAVEIAYKYVPIPKPTVHELNKNHNQLWNIQQWQAIEYLWWATRHMRK